MIPVYNIDNATPAEREAIQAWDDLSGAAAILTIKEKQRGLTPEEKEQFETVKAAMFDAYYKMPKDLRDAWERLGSG